jgi:hypothetical protein
VKFSPPESGIRVWALHDEGDGLVRIGVTDHGPGIPRQSRAVIFERFKQVTQEAAPSAKGFGLGLHIAKELVGLNFGDINVHSSIGVGSVFSFTVPTWNPPSFLQHYLRIGYFRRRARCSGASKPERRRQKRRKLAARAIAPHRSGLPHRPADWLIIIRGRKVARSAAKLPGQTQAGEPCASSTPPPSVGSAGTWAAADPSPDSSAFSSLSRITRLRLSAHRIGYIDRA